MIIRKPYAILIKYFKLIHATLFVIMTYLAYKSWIISKFFSDYFADGENVMGQEITDRLFSSLLYILALVVIFGLIIVLVLMLAKKKPIKYYIGGILVYIVFFVILNVDQNLISQMEIELLGARTVRAISDITLIVIGFQLPIIVITFVRATGFNIQRFEFEKDLQNLNITEEDNEEVEIGVEVDSEVWKRKLRKRLRHARYVYLENKTLFFIMAIILVAVTGYFVYIKTGMNEKVYRQGEIFNTNNFVMLIEKSYITDTNYKLERLPQGKTLVVVRLSIKNRFKMPMKLELSKMELHTHNKNYHPTNKYQKEMLDLGKSYFSTNISGDWENYILCYEVPSNYLNKKITLKYIDNINSANKKVTTTYRKVELVPIDLRKKEKEKKYKLGNVMSLENTVLETGSLKINSFDIQDEYLLNYNFCAKAGECFQSTEYIKPNIITNYDKKLLRLNLSYNLDNKFIQENYTDVFKFINAFATLQYTIDGQTKNHNLELVQVKPLKAGTGNNLYLEVLDEVSKAEKIDLIFKIRNQEYQYAVK